MVEFFRLIYCSIIFWVIAKIFWKLFIAFKTFVLPHVIGECNLSEKFGSWAVITGSSDGIGKAFAKELARRGLNIVLISRSAEKLQRVASEIESEFNVKTKFIVADFSDGPIIYEHIKTELENIPVAVLVNNVATTPSRFHYIDEMPAEFCWHMTYVNISSTIMMTNLILPQMKKRKRGAIINISSASENIPLVFAGLYSPSKALVNHFSHLLKYETASFGITVQLLSPFFVRTNMLKMLPLIYKLNNSVFIPDGETYVKHAIKTLGFSAYTSGYWAHGLLHFLVELIPGEITAKVAAIFLTSARRSFSKKVCEKDR